jgi:hypothetical protein
MAHDTPPEDSLQFHPDADLVPLMDDEEFEALKADLRANGLRDPIVLHEGKILDGRSRYLACRELGIPLKLRDWDGNGSSREFLLSANLRRRHLTAGQQAALATEIEETGEGGSSQAQP